MNLCPNNAQGPAWAGDHLADIGVPTFRACVGRNDRRPWDLYAAVRADTVDREDRWKVPAATPPSSADLAGTGVSRPSYCLSNQTSSWATMSKTLSQSRLCDKQVFSDARAGLTALAYI